MAAGLCLPPPSGAGQPGGLGSTSLAHPSPGRRSVVTRSPTHLHSEGHLSEQQPSRSPPLRPRRTILYFTLPLD